MRKPFVWAPRRSLLALLLILLAPRELSAQSQPPPGQSATQEKVAPPQVAGTPSDSITLPDGTPLTLQLVHELSSATAKDGDVVEFTIPYPLRMDALVVVPKGSVASGIVVRVNHPHMLMKSGEVRVAVEKLVLPNGETAALRSSKSASGKPRGMPVKPKPGPCDVSCGNAGAAGLVILPILLFSKGDEQIYPAGIWTTAYFNGPHNFDRAALLKVQPPSYNGSAQVFFNALSSREVLFCGQERVGDLSFPLWLELNPGTYSFSTRLESAKGSARVKAPPVQLEVHEDQQYWIQRERRGLVVKDPQQHQTEFDIVRNASRVDHKDLTSLPPQDSCPQAARP